MAEQANECRPRPSLSSWPPLRPGQPGSAPRRHLLFCPGAWPRAWSTTSCSLNPCSPSVPHRFFGTLPYAYEIKRC